MSVTSEASRGTRRCVTRLPYDESVDVALFGLGVGCAVRSDRRGSIDLLAYERVINNALEFPQSLPVQLCCTIPAASI